MSLIGIGMYSYYSIQHYQSAVYFAERATQLEKGYSRTEFDADRECLIATYVTGALLCTSTLLDALVGEIFDDAAHNMTGRLPSLSDEQKARIAEQGAKEKVQRTPPLSRMNTILLAASREIIAADSSMAKTQQSIASLRNVITHYRGTYFDVGTEGFLRPNNISERGLLNDLVGKFPLLGGGPSIGTATWISSGFARWAVRETIGYADLFFQRLGETPTYDHVRRTISDPES